MESHRVLHPDRVLDGCRGDESARTRCTLLRARLGERTLHGARKEAVNRAGIAETHFVLGRVGVDVHATRVHLEEQDVSGLTSMV